MLGVRASGSTVVSFVNVGVCDNERTCGRFGTWGGRGRSLPRVDFRELLAVNLVHVATGGVVGERVRVVQRMVPVCATAIMSLQTRNTPITHPQQ